jgi:hypothetical protein
VLQSNATILLTDTNAAYKLYFFRRKKIIPESSIIIDGIGIVEFHPIVLEEVESHIGFWNKANEYHLSNKTEYCPNFFKELLESDFPQIIEFIKANICSSVAPVNIHTQDFSDKRKIYEAERERLQKKWKSNGVSGRKVSSKPSSKDYSILYSAERHAHKIITHDEILFAVATEILDDSSLLKVEDVIAQIYEKNPQSKPDIECVLTNLEYLGEVLVKTRIFGL